MRVVPVALKRFELSKVAKLVPSYKAVYAIVRPNAVPSECAEMIVSRADNGAEGGSRARIAVTPAVMFWWVRCTAWTWSLASL
jgi:hypothetical protein